MAAGAKTTPVAVAVEVTATPVPLFSSAIVPMLAPLTELLMVPLMMLLDAARPLIVRVLEPRVTVDPLTELSPAMLLLPLAPETSKAPWAPARLMKELATEPEPVSKRVPLVTLMPPSKVPAPVMVTAPALEPWIFRAPRALAPVALMAEKVAAPLPAVTMKPPELFTVLAVPVEAVNCTAVGTDSVPPWKTKLSPVLTLTPTVEVVAVARVTAAAWASAR